MTPRAAKQKGKQLEDWVADQIVALGIDPKARRDGGSGNGNREKGDISTSMMVLGSNVGIECKNQATLAIPEWWRQTRKLEATGREPVLAYKLPGAPLEDTLVTIYLDTFLKLAIYARGYEEQNTTRDVVVKIEDTDQWVRREKLEALRRAIDAALKVV